MSRPIRRADTPVFPEEDVRRGIELLFFAYRDFTSDPDRILAALGMGRAHHRVVHFVGGNPGITVGDLLGILRITKQSLNRVLGQLVREGYVVARPGATDRRERWLALTPAGEALARRLFDVQRARVGSAYRAAGPAAVQGFRRVLLGLVNPADRERLRPPSARPSAARRAPDPGRLSASKRLR